MVNNNISATVNQNPHSSPRPFHRTSLWVGGGLLAGMLLMYFLLALAETKKGRTAPLPMRLPVAGFSLMNQAGQVTTLADLTNRVWVADIIFTRCASSCPIMSRQMKSLQDALPAESRAKLVSLTTNPEYDTPPVLAQYAAHYQADTNRWMFLTGSKLAVAALAGDSLKLGSVPIKPEDRKDAFDFFIHSTLFVIVDKHANVRQAFETTGAGLHWEDVQSRILAAVQQLESEP